MTRPPPGPTQPQLEAFRPAADRGDGPGGAPRPRPVSRRLDRQQGRQRGMGLLSWLLLIVLGFVGMLAGAAAVLVLTLPETFVRDRIVAEVKRQTGRDLVIAGPAALRFYPSIGFSLGDVSLSAPAGMGDAALVRMASLDVSVRLLPLLAREVTIERLVLVKPVFELHVDPDGRRTWDMAAATPSPGPVRLAQLAGPASDAPAGPIQVSPTAPSANAAALEQLSLGDVRIEDGTVHYSDARTGAKEDVSAINLKLALKSISKPLEAAGDVVWKSEKIGFDGALTSIKSVMEERPAKLVVKISGNRLAASYDGTFLAKGTLDAEGAVTAAAPSVKALARWLGTELPPVPGFGPLDLKGQLRLAGKVVTLSNAVVSLDQATGSGQLTVDASPARPTVKGSLKLTELDLNKYIGGDGTSAPASSPAGAAAKSPAGVPAKSIDDLLGKEPAGNGGPQVRGYTQRAGWSEGQIDASALGLVDADVKLTLDRLLIQNIRIDQSQLTVGLHNAVLKTTFEDVKLYGGKAKGFVTLDAATPKIAAIGANMTLDGIEAAPLLKDAADMDWLAGNGRLSLVASGQGQSQRQIVETLTGKAEMTFTNGAIVGWNVAGIVRNVTQGKLTGFDRTPTEKTDFSEFASSWTITNGLAENQDLRLISPLLRVAGSGNVMLPAREIDYLVRPTLVASLQGQGATEGSNGLEIPVRITGGWEKPKLTPDVSSVLKDPNKALETVKELGRQLKGKSADDIVKGLLGKDSGATGSTDSGSSDKEKGKKLLEQLFKR
ncbi:MAG: AsmA family protein [Hyphomicrobium sp.]